MVDYLGSTINVVASSLGLVTVVICVLAGAGLDLASRHRRVRIGAAGSYLVLWRSGKIAPPTRPRSLAAPPPDALLDPLGQASARSRSAIRSSMSSMPTLSRMRSPGTSS